MSARRARSTSAILVPLSLDFGDLVVVWRSIKHRTHTVKANALNPGTFLGSPILSSVVTTMGQPHICPFTTAVQLMYEASTLIDGLTWKAGMTSSLVMGKVQLESFSRYSSRSEDFCQLRQSAAVPMVSLAVCMAEAMEGRPFYQALS